MVEMSEQNQRSNWIERALPALAVALVASLFVVGIADHEPWTPDEPRETQMARDMVAGSSRIVPQLSGEPFVEKPPLYYWISAALMWAADGINPAHIARGVSSALTLLTVVLTGWFAARMWGRETGLAAGLMLSTMAGTLELSHWIRIDAALAFFVCAGALLFIAGVPARRPYLLWGGYLSAGLAFLTKGLVAWAILVLPWAACAALEFRSVRAEWRRHGVGLVLALLPVIVWAAAFKSAAGPELWREWFWDNQIGRFIGATRHLGHIHGPLYYVPQIIAVLLPWTPLVIAGFASRAVRNSMKTNGTHRFARWAMAAWAIGGLLLLSASGTKRTIYLYPLLPGFAVLAAVSAVAAPRWAWRTVRGITALLAFLSWPLIVIDVAANGREASLVFTFRPVVLVLALAASWIWLRGGARRVPQAAAVSACFYLAAMLALIPAFEAFKNYGPAVRQFAAAIAPEQRERVCGWNLDQTTRSQLPYYADWTVTNVYDSTRLALILAGGDPQFDLVIVQMEKRFPPRETVLPPWRETLRVDLPTRRTLALITADAALEDSASSHREGRSTRADDQRSGN